MYHLACESILAIIWGIIDTTCICSVTDCYSSRVLSRINYELFAEWGALLRHQSVLLDPLGTVLILTCDSILVNRASLLCLAIGEGKILWEGY